MLPANGERGEVALRIGAVDLVIAAEIGGLAALSTALRCKSLAELYELTLALEVNAVMAAIRCLTVRGDAEAAVAALTLADFPAAKAAFEAALLHHMQGRENTPPKRNEEAEPFSFRRWLRMAVAVLGWRPAAFWRATVTEFADAVDAHAEARGGAKDAPPSRDEMAELLKRYG